MNMNIGECDECKSKVPSCFLKRVADESNLCHPCYSASLEASGQVDSFFEGKTKREINRLRQAVPKYPEAISTLPVDHPKWADEFTIGASHKASWYGFKNVFEFFGECLK